MDKSQYYRQHQQSLSDPETFWGDLARSELHWFAPFSTVFSNHPDNRFSWFTDGSLNISYNCLDRHLETRPDTPAIIDITETGEVRTHTYAQLHALVCQTAHTLSELGVSKGDTVTIYMPHIAEQAATMLACARIGAIHSIVYGGFSSEALHNRINQAKSTILITADYTYRRGNPIHLLETARTARANTSVTHTLVLTRSADTKLNPADGEQSFTDLVSRHEASFPAAALTAEDPLFILYTSGTTGTPKGVVHTIGGYHLYTHYTTKMAFQVSPGTIFWCTADCGWITGHSYVVYGPLSNGATTLMVEGAPDYPDQGRWWQIIEKYDVEVFYTAPTALRLLKKYGNDIPREYNLTSLKVLGTVGEPINPDVWKWYKEVIGNGSCPVVDTWWQTETGGHMILTLPGMPEKPGIAGLPFFGIDAAVVSEDGKPLPPGEKGYLVITKPWPSALRDCWNNPELYQKYWQTIPPFYTTGDFAIQDADGCIQILGRSDDVISVSGHRIGSAELESALVAHPDIVEAAVIGKAHEVTGESIKAFVIHKRKTETSLEIETELKDHVKKTYGSHAIPNEIEIVPTLPKTRSGKIMRRMLKAREEGRSLGDTSTLEE